MTRHLLIATALSLLLAAPASAAPTLTPVDGGAGYYGQFSNPLPTDPTYFPIATWGSYNHNVINRDLDAQSGINTYVWAADTSFVDDIRADGRFKIIQDAGTLAGVGSETAGKLTDDEADMRCGNCWPDLETKIRNLGCVTRCADGRFLYANYGKGVIFWQSDTQAQRWVNGTAAFGRYQDVVSNDIYWFTDPDSCTFAQGGRFLLGADVQVPAAQCQRAANYGYVVDEMRKLDALDGKRQPVWNFIEAGHPFTESSKPSITGPQARAAAWHSVIAGARGVLWFVHSFGGPCAGDHNVLRTNCEGTRAAITATNQQIKALAPVLNGPTVTSDHTASGSVRSMVKWAPDEHFYFFTGAVNSGGTGTFTMSCLGDATATRVAGESGSVAISDGQFSDSFADKNTVHVYRVDGGSTCDLGVDPDPTPTPTPSPTPTATPTPSPSPTPTATPTPTPEPTATPTPTATPDPPYAPACAPTCDEQIAALKAKIAAAQAALEG